MSADREISITFELGGARVSDTAYVLTVTGEIDPYTAPSLKDELHRLIDTGGREITVDLSPCSFIDSTGLHVLLEGRGRLAGAGGRLLLVVTDRNILRSFQLSRLDRIFGLEVYGSRTQALAAAGVRPPAWQTPVRTQLQPHAIPD